MGIVFAWNEVLSCSTDQHVSCDEADYKDYSRQDNNEQEIAIIFWRVTLGGGILWLCHTR